MYMTIPQMMTDTMSVLNDLWRLFSRLNWPFPLCMCVVLVLIMFSGNDIRILRYVDVYEMTSHYKSAKSITRHVVELHRNQTESENSAYSNILPFPYFQRQLPNAYLYPINDTIYKDAVVGFVHNPKSAGTTIKRCMLSMLGEQELVPMLMSFKTAAGIRQDLLNHITTRSKYYMGDSTLGICEYGASQPCTYFTMLREPYDRVISHYYFCKDGGTSFPPCNNTLEEFVIKSCSLFYRQTTVRFNCQQELDNGDSCSDISTCPLSWYCNATEVHVDNLRITKKERQSILTYVLDNLDKMFGVIGIVEEFETSMKLFQDTFGLPFYDQCNENHYNSGQYLHREQKNSTRSNEIERAKERLRSNLDVRRCLGEDEKIYKKATEIFKLQIQKYEFKMKQEMLDDFSAYRTP